MVKIQKSWNLEALVPHIIKPKFYSTKIDPNNFPELSNLSKNRLNHFCLIFAALVNSFARNPSLRQQLFGFTILGFALTEAIGLFALMMAFLILFG